MEIKVIFKYVFLALFIAASAVHLWDSWRDNGKRRKITKPMLLLFLLAFYCCATTRFSWVLAAALLTSWLGDVLLMPSGTKWFIMGGVSFLVSHLLFIFVYLPQVNWASVIWWVLIPAAILYYGVSVKITLSVKNNMESKAMLAPMILYLLINSTMNLFAMAQLMSLKNTGTIVAYAGAVLFFLSDCTLYLVRYHSNKDLIFKKHFTVMFTYILGECLITVGMLMI
ncbi:MAG: lysoplasmalogenase [Clostridia bacterium]|nr:lysoplasmalogenase [Clostridia bacterium]